MNVLVAGGKGFLGTRLVRLLARKGDRVTVLTRGSVPPVLRDGVRFARWDGVNSAQVLDEVAHADAVVNLSGASVGEGRWTKKRKREIEESRIVTTETLVRAMSKTSSPPRVFLCMSAVGIYGEGGEEELTETHAQGGGFLAELSRRWEGAAVRARDRGIRVVLPRTALVLSSEGGALGRMILPYRLFLGGPLGSGEQWFPWVHADDAVASMAFALASEDLSGPFNVSAPGAVRMEEFARELGKALRRPSFLRVPSWVLMLALGEMAETILRSQRVIPQVLLRHGYQFRFPHLDQALRDIWHP